MATLANGVVAERGTKIVDLIGNLQGKLNTAWRAASKEKDADKLAEAQKAIDAAEAELAEACRPTAVEFAIRRADK